jgi:hypothetical protein
VLPPARAVSGAVGSTACAPGKSPKQATIDRMIAHMIVVFRFFIISSFQVLTFVPALLFFRAGKNVFLSPKAEI